MGRFRLYTVPPRSPASAISRLMAPSLLFAKHHGRKCDASCADSRAERLDQTDSSIITGSSNDSPIPVVEFSGQTCDCVASSMANLSDGTLAIADISNFKTTKIVDKRLGPSGVKYKCEFDVLVGRLVEPAKMGRIRNGLIRARRLAVASKIALSYILVVSNSTTSVTPFNRVK